MKKATIILALCAILASSCSDFLGEQKPQGTLCGQAGYIGLCHLDFGRRHQLFVLDVELRRAFRRRL